MKIIIALVVAFIIYAIINGIGQFGHLDTTGKAGPGVQVVAIVIAGIAFLWIVSKSGNSS